MRLFNNNTVLVQDDVGWLWQILLGTNILGAETYFLRDGIIVVSLLKTRNLLWVDETEHKLLFYHFSGPNCEKAVFHWGWCCVTIDCHKAELCHKTWHCRSIINTGRLWRAHLAVSHTSQRHHRVYAFETECRRHHDRRYNSTRGAANWFRCRC